MVGAQLIGSLWRLYPTSMESRANLLVAGIELANIRVNLHETNPFILYSTNGETVDTTRVLISDIPLSFSDDEIEGALKKLGCHFMSPLKHELDRDAVSGKLSKWKTGRRFVFVVVPKTPPPKTVPIGIFKAKLYHREQRLENQRRNTVLQLP